MLTESYSIFILLLSIYQNGKLDEVVVRAYLKDSDVSGGGGSGNGGGVYYTYGNSYGSYINGATSNGMNPNVGGGTSFHDLVFDFMAAL